MMKRRKKKRLLLFLALTFAFMLNSTAQDNHLSRYQLKPEVGIIFTPKLKYDLIGIGGLGGLVLENPATRLAFKTRLNYLFKTYYWEKHATFGYGRASTISIQVAYELLHIIGDKPMNLGLDASLLFADFLEYRANYPYQLGVFFGQEYKRFNFEMALIGIARHTREPHVLTDYFYGMFVNLIVSYSFDFSKNR